MDMELATKEFYRRRAENAGKQIDNSKLVAGSPMYYYCDGCGIHVETKPEGWCLNPPPKYCDGCRTLAEHGVLDRLTREPQPP